MKHASTGILASIAILVTGGAAFGQSGQCDCNGSGGSYVGYQSSDWNQCNSCMSGGQCNGCNRNRVTGRMGEFCAQPRMGNTCMGRFCATKAYPDSGWAPPVHNPVNYDGAWYGSYHPQAWYGNPGGGFVAIYPQVYQPTDTTQLGYSYTKVPTWQSRPGMIPGVPMPSNFHTRGCSGGGCFGRHHGGYQQPCQSCQTCNNGYNSEHIYSYSGPQYSTPNGQHVVRPVVAQKQGLLGGFRLSSLSNILD